MESRSFLPLLGVPFVLVLGNSMLIPLLPMFQTRLELTRFEAGLIITAFSVPAGALIPFTGFLSDRIGRKPVMVSAIATLAAGGIIAFLALWISGERGFSALIIARIVQGIGASGTMQIAMALAGDIFQGQERFRRLGMLEASNAIGKVLSPILGSLAALVSWFFVFLVYPLIALPVALAICLMVKENKQPALYMSLKQYFVNLGSQLENKMHSFVVTLSCGFLCLLMLFGTLFYLSDTLETRLNINGILKGIILALPVLAVSVTSAAASRKQTLPPVLGTVIGLAITAISLLGLVYVNIPAVFYGGMVTMGIGLGLALPRINTLVTSTVPDNQRGLVTSIYGSLRFFGTAVGPPVFGFVMDAGPDLLFILASIAMGAAAGAAYAFIDEKSMLPPELRNPKNQ